MINERIVFNENAQCFELSATDTVPENLVRATEIFLTLLSAEFHVRKSDILDTDCKDEAVVDCRVILVMFIYERTCQYGYNSDLFVYRFFHNESKRLINGCIGKFDNWKYQSTKNAKKLSAYKTLTAEANRLVPVLFEQTQEVKTPVITKVDTKIVFLETPMPVVDGARKYSSKFSHDEYFEILLTCAIYTFPGLTREMIILKSREDDILVARNLIMREMRKFFKREISLAKIGSYFEGDKKGTHKDHATVINAIKALEKLENKKDQVYILKEPKFMKHLAEMKSTIEAGGNLAVSALISTTRAMDIVNANFNGEADLVNSEIISQSNIGARKLIEVIQRFDSGFEIEKLNI